MPGVRYTWGHLPHSSPGDHATVVTSAEMSPPCPVRSPIPSSVSWEHFRGEFLVHDPGPLLLTQPLLWAGATHPLLQAGHILLTLAPPPALLSLSLPPPPPPRKMGGRNQMIPMTDRERQAGFGRAASREWGWFLSL